MIDSSIETMLLSEAVLAKGWDTPEEDEAWKSLSEFSQTDMAKRFIFEKSQLVIDNALPWHKPHISGDEHEGISFEWWYRTRCLVFFVNDVGVEWLQAWGPHIWDEMDEGQLESPEQFLGLYRWLLELDSETPSAALKASIDELESGGGERFDSVDDLFASWEDEAENELLIESGVLPKLIEAALQTKPSGNYLRTQANEPVDH